MKKEIRQQVLDKCGGRCAYCGNEITLKAMQVDHVQAKRRDGKDDIDNFLPACRSCNATKATYTVEEFRVRLWFDVDRIRRDSSKFRILERFGLIEATQRPIVFYYEKL